MLRFFESFFKKKPRYDIEKLRKEAEKYLEEHYHPPRPVVAVSEPVSEYTVSNKEEHPQAQFMTWDDSEDSHHAQFQQIDYPDEDLFSSLSWAHLNEAEMKALGIVLNKPREKTFSELLSQYIRDHGYRDSYVYKRAQVDKRLFSKIMSNSYYRPAKDTVIALAMALHCNLEEANKLLKSAGFQFSDSIRRDMLIEYFFINQIYDVIVANGILDDLGEKIIGREKVG